MLDDLLDKLPSLDLRRLRVDVSDFFPDCAPLELEYIEPTAPVLFRVTEEVGRIQADYPDFPESLAASVALLALSHSAPDPGQGAVGRFYAELALRHRDLFLYLLREYGNAFPDATRLGQAVEMEKKGSADRQRDI